MAFDSRTKIVSEDEFVRLAANGPVVVGYFDPLLASHAEQLAAMADGGALFAVVADAPEALLPLTVRAELVAALRCVRAVTTANGGLDTLLGRLRGPVTHEEVNDEERRRALLAHIRARHEASE